MLASASLMSAALPGTLAQRSQGDRKSGKRPRSEPYPRQTTHRWAKVNSVSSRPLPHQISGEAPPRHGQNHSNPPLRGLQPQQSTLMDKEGCTGECSRFTVVEAPAEGMLPSVASQLPTPGKCSHTLVQSCSGNERGQRQSARRQLATQIIAEVDAKMPYPRGGSSQDS